MQTLNQFLKSDTEITSVPQEGLRKLFVIYQPSSDWNDQPFEIHPAYGVVCDFRDSEELDPILLKRLVQAIDHCYSAKDLSVCNEGWGGLDGIDSGKELVGQCCKFPIRQGDMPHEEIIPTLQVLVEAEVISQKEFDSLTAPV